MYGTIIAGTSRTIWGDHKRFLKPIMHPSDIILLEMAADETRMGIILLQVEWMMFSMSVVTDLVQQNLNPFPTEDPIAEAAVVGYPHPIKGQGCMPTSFTGWFDIFRRGIKIQQRVDKWRHCKS